MSRPPTYIYWNQNSDRLNLLKEHGFLSPAELSWLDRILRFTRRVEMTCIQDAKGRTFGVAFRRYRDHDVVVGTLDMVAAKDGPPVFSYQKPETRRRPATRHEAI